MAEMWDIDGSSGGAVLPFARTYGGDLVDRDADQEPPAEDYASWDDDPGPYYDDRGYGRDLGSLTMVVLMDDKLVDTVRRPVAGSGYECAALELGRGTPPPPPRIVEVPAQPRHELERTWLRMLVGGAEQLERLTRDPLPDEPLDVAALPVDLRERVRGIAARVDEPALALFGVEGRTACRRLLSRAVAAEPALLRGYDHDTITAGAVLHAFAKGNDLIGPGCALTSTQLWTRAGLKSSPHDRARRFAHAVAGPEGVPRDRNYHRGEPAVWRLGSADLLTGRFRSFLLVLRDIADAEAQPPADRSG
jgi:hypothetical protein